jgi:flagellar protein FlaG
MAQNLKLAIEQINNVLKDGGRGLSFVLDPVIDRPIVKVMREDTGEVIRQYPNEAVVRVAHNIEKLKGVLFEGLI